MEPRRRAWRAARERELTEEEIKLVAEVLAKIGGNWYPERAGSAPKAVSNRHREVARVIVGAVERLKEANRSAADDASAAEGSLEDQSLDGAGEDELHVGASVLYRPPNDKRTLACRIEELEDGRAYVVPELQEIGWVSTHSLLPLNKASRDNGPGASRPAAPAVSADGTGAQPQAAPQPLILPERSLEIVDLSAKVKHYYSSSGEWIAFRRSETDRYLFDRKGNWIGWFPWDDKDIVDIEGKYLGTVLYGERIYRKKEPAPDRREAGFVMDPGPAKYVGYPGFAAHLAPPYGFKDVDMAQILTRRRSWLTARDPASASGAPSAFQVWMAKIGLGGVARAIEGMIRTGK